MKKIKAKYVCTNCGHKQDVKYIEAMYDAGFGLNHLACKNCGQHAVKDTSK